jgi:hypothetical protein
LSNESDEEVMRLGRQAEDPIALREPALAHIQRESAELVNFVDSHGP